MISVSAAAFASSVNSSSLPSPKMLLPRFFTTSRKVRGALFAIHERFSMLYCSNSPSKMPAATPAPIAWLSEAPFSFALRTVLVIAPLPISTPDTYGFPPLIAMFARLSAQLMPV